MMQRPNRFATGSLIFFGVTGSLGLYGLIQPVHGAGRGPMAFMAFAPALIVFDVSVRRTAVDPCL